MPHPVNMTDVTDRSLTARLFQIPCRGCDRRRPHFSPGGLAEGVPGGVRDRQEQDAADPPHQARTRAQLLRLLLRDPQLAREGLSTGQAGALTSIHQF